MINIYKNVEEEYPVKPQHIRPLLEAVCAGFIVFATMFISSYFLYYHAINTMKNEVKNDLMNSALTIRTLVNGDIQASFTDPSQQKSLAYIDAITPLKKINEAVPNIAYIYTMRMIDGKVYFILDSSRPSTTKQSAIGNAKLMESYEEASPELLNVWKTKQPVISKPYQDEWGTFISAFLPFYDSNNNMVGVLGVDLNLNEFENHLHPIHFSGLRALVLGIILSVMTGILVFIMRRYAKQMHASRQSMISDLKDAVGLARNAAKAKAEFLANMSHEIRTPMNAILGFTKNLLASSLSPAQKEQLTTIQDAGNALLQIINEILDLSKIEAGKITLSHESFDFVRTLDNVIQLLSPQAEAKSIELGLILDPNIPKILVGDQGRLRQGFINLIGNAIKFTDQGGVYVHVHSELTGKKIRLHCEVTDTGIGIDPGSITKIFDEFSQAKHNVGPKREGTGLGLAITKKIIQMMLGDITVESTIGKGSSFKFSLVLDIEDKTPILELKNIASSIQHLALVGASPWMKQLLKKQCEYLHLHLTSYQSADAYTGINKACHSRHAIQWVMFFNATEQEEMVMNQLRGNPDLKGITTIMVDTASGIEQNKLNALCDHSLIKPIKFTPLRKLLTSSAA